MTLYMKLFGSTLMSPADDDGGGGGGDRGDDFVPATTGNTAAAGDKAAAAENEEDDLRVATGKEEGDEGDDKQPTRDEKGKFTKKNGEAVIPKARFDEAVRRERERAETAERELQAIREQQKQYARGADIDAAVTQMKELRGAQQKALIAGDDAKATELANEIDRLSLFIANENSNSKTAQAKEETREQIRWEMTIEAIYAKYPELNDDEANDDFDQDLTDEVADAVAGIMRRERLPRSAALLKAVERVMSRRPPPAAASDDDTGGRKGLDRGPEQDRKKAAVAKNLDAASRQPASTKRVGADSDRHGQTSQLPAVSEMSFEEFSALPDATRAKLRGDFV
ncbi:MAG: hypothetical protein KBH41_14070 [Azonexus sp.]|nr:hypothetical protein [Azonexus sp.]